MVLFRIRVPLVESDCASLFEPLFENHHASLALLDTKFNFIRVNAAYAAADHKKPEDYSGKNHFALYPNLENQKIFENVIMTGEAYHTHAKTFEYTYNNDRGVTYWDWSLLPMRQDGAITGCLLFLIDVTHRIRAEQSMGFLEGILTNSADTIICCNLDGKIIYSNIASKTETKTDMVGISIFDFMLSPEITRARKMFNYAAKTQKVVSYDVDEEVSYNKKAAHIRIAPVVIAGQFSYLVYTISDLSERMVLINSLEKEKILLQKLAKERERSTAIINHELRTPVNAILNATDFIDTTNLSEDNRKYIAIIESGAKQVKEVIDHVLTQVGKPTRNLDVNKTRFNLLFSLNELMDIHRSLAAQGVQLVLRKKGHFPAHFAGDLAKINTVVRNLLSNAVKFTDQGEIVLSIEYDIISKRVILSVSDTGTGIYPEFKDRIFDEYFQVPGEANKGRGVGIGLNLVKRNIELLDGELDLFSEVGRGTTFVAKIPLEACTTWLSERPESDFCSICINRPDELNQKVGNLDKLRGMKYLIVEDNEVNAFIYRQIFQNSQIFNIDVAETGAEAIKKFAHEHYDIVLLDLHLPDMTGLAVFEEMKLRDKNVKAVAVTADVTDEMRARCFEMGIIDFLPKPFNGQRLLDTLVYCMAFKPFSNSS